MKGGVADPRAVSEMTRVIGGRIYRLYIAARQIISVARYLASARLASQSRDCFSPFRSNSIFPLMVSTVTLPL